jgi:cytochrome c peroxidase
MHDGRFATLEQVVEHYAGGGIHPESIGAVDSQIRPLDLSAEEQRELVEFLRNLTDTDFVARKDCS